MARRNSFARALADAEKRLGKAVAELETAQQNMLALHAEIPALNRTIAALKYQMDPAPAKLEDLRAESLKPSDLAALAGPQDLSGIGSHQPSEDELLPEPEGVPLLEK